MKQTIEIDNDLIRISDISAVRLKQSVITIILKNGVSLVNDKVSLDHYEEDNNFDLSDQQVINKYYEYTDQRILELKEKIHEIEQYIGNE